MDLMAYVPDAKANKISQINPRVIHDCEVPSDEDRVKASIKGNSIKAKFCRCWLRKRMVSPKHPFTRWNLKSTTAMNYEISKHLKTYPYMIHPFSLFRIYWESAMVVFGFVSLVVIPVFLTFYSDQTEKWYIYSDVMDGIIVCDILMWFFTGYYDYRTKIIVLDPKIVALKYLRGTFFVDILPALPFRLIDSMVIELTWYCTALNILKIIRIRAFVSYTRKLRYVYKINFQRYKLLEIGIVIIISVHWMACLEYYVPLVVSNIYGKNRESWIYSKYLEKKRTNIDKYLVCLNRAIVALVCSAHYLDVKTPEDMLLNLLLSVIGFLGFICMLARFMYFIKTFHSASKKDAKRIQQLQEYMRHKELPLSLQRRLLLFCNFCNKKGYHRDRRIINEVSPYLREELLLHKYQRLIDSVTIFQHLSRPIVAKLIAALHTEVFLENNVIVQAGTKGNAFFYIQSGTVAVYTIEEKEICHLESGAHFGELALLMKNEHTIATIIAIETCETYVLTRENFLRIIQSHSDLLKYLRDIILQNLGNVLSLEEASKRRNSITTAINISNVRGRRKP